MREHRTDIAEIEGEMEAALKIVRDALQPVDGSEADTALCGVETFVAIALQVYAKTNPSKLRSETRTFEIRARLDGIPVVQGAA